MKNDETPKKADVLTTLSWVSFPQKVIEARLASMYLKAEASLKRSKRRRYNTGPTKQEILQWIKTHYVPPHGKGTALVEAVVVEAERQRSIVAKRASMKPDPVGKKSRRDRLAAVAASMYSIWSGKDCTQPVVAQPIALGSVGRLLAIVDGGSWSTRPRLILRDRDTGHTEVVVYNDRKIGTTVYEAVMALLPRWVVRQMFTGLSIELAVNPVRFIVNGETVQPSGVEWVYTDPHKTLAVPG